MQNQEETDFLVTEGLSLPASPCPSNDSLNLGSQSTKRKDVDWINTIGSMIKTSSDKLAADIHQKLDENAKKISKKINEVDKKQTEKLKELDRKVEDVKCELVNLETLPQDLNEIKEHVVNVEKNLGKAIEKNKQDIAATKQKNR